MFDRNSAADELAVDEKGRSGLHADLFAVVHVLLDGIRELLAADALLELVAVGAGLLGELLEVGGIQLVLILEGHIVELEELIRALVVHAESRFGRAEWLTPYTDETVKALAASGVRRLAVVTPGFSADCLETIEEIGGENAEYFHQAGGEKFTRIACLNDSDGGMRVIEAVVRRELQGWI